jgi:predicted short-subunit dehydrogenase-like oxidoreductase (DUF2520 family)
MAGRLSIVGSGRVGRALGSRLREHGWKIDLVIARSEISARRAVRIIGSGSACARIPRRIVLSSVILVCTPDDAIPHVAAELARVGGEELAGRVVLHTSGALDASVLKAVRAHGAAVGAMHPLQSFSGVSVPPMEGKIFAIEGDRLAVKVARQIVRALGGSPVRIAGSKRLLYHAAASFAAGHVLAVEEAAVRMMIEAGMKRRESVRAVRSLTCQVLNNFERLGPVAAWTGPLARTDYNLVSAHVDAMRELPAEFSEAYSALNRLAARVLDDDPERVLAELQNSSVRNKLKAKAVGGKA